jgi:molybdopterin/thiamine biosynthesis adenylyltransferase/rhodanese-related sulfurtransferase
MVDCCIMSERYSRQTALPEIGVEGQERLRNASVLVVGAGGLGCAVLPYLCAAGIGRLTIVDHDRVEESNLHRQPLYRMRELGVTKVSAARNSLLEMNPDVRIDALAERLTPSNVADLVESVDLAVDAADSFAVSYVLSDECQRVSKPLVSASVLGLSGYVGGFCGGAPSYRAVFPEIPRQAGSCATSGVLGTAVGVMGTLQAHCTIVLVLGLEPSSLGQMITVDFRTLRMGGFSFRSALEPVQSAVLPFIAPNQVTGRDIVVDLRGLEETPISPLPSALRISVDEIERSGACFPVESRIVLCCRTGVRAWRAARALQRRGHRHLALIAFGE